MRYQLSVAKHSEQCSLSHPNYWHNFLGSHPSCAASSGLHTYTTTHCRALDFCFAMRKSCLRVIFYSCFFMCLRTLFARLVAVCLVQSRGGISTSQIASLARCCYPYNQYQGGKASGFVAADTAALASDYSTIVRAGKRGKFPDSWPPLFPKIQLWNTIAVRRSRKRI